MTTFTSNGKQVIVAHDNHHVADATTEESAAMLARALDFYTSTMPWRTALELDRDMSRALVIGATELLRLVDVSLREGDLEGTNAPELQGAIGQHLRDALTVDMGAPYLDRPIINQNGDEVGKAQVHISMLAQVQAFTDENGTAWIAPTPDAYRATCLALEGRRVAMETWQTHIAHAVETLYGPDMPVAARTVAAGLNMLIAPQEVPANAN